MKEGEYSLPKTPRKILMPKVKPPKKELKDINEHAVEWTPEVVYKVYRNDNLEDLPVGILNDMLKYINSIIEKKEGN